MIPIENEKDVHPSLCVNARQFCENIGAISIHNIACLGDGDYRIMYWIEKDGKRKMEAVLLRLPSV